VLLFWVWVRSSFRSFYLAFFTAVALTLQVKVTPSAKYFSTSYTLGQSRNGPIGLATVAYTYNLSYLRGRDRRIMVLGQHRQKISETLVKRAVGMVQVTESLPSKHKTLSLKSSITPPKNGPTVNKI
jgi:hypothetical protein